MENFIIDIPGQARQIIPKTNPTAVRAALQAQRRAAQAQNAQPTWQHPNEMYDFIGRQEDYRDYSYLDTAGKVTVGIGYMVPNVEEMKKLPLVDRRSKLPVGELRKQQEYEMLHNFAQQKMQNGKLNVVSEHYKGMSTLMLPENVAAEITRQHIDQEQKHVRNNFPTYDQLNPKAQIGIMDLRYNLGGKKFNRKNWPKLHDALEKFDYTTAAKEVDRIGVGEARNTATKQLFLDAAAERMKTAEEFTSSSRGLLDF